MVKIFGVHPGNPVRPTGSCDYRDALDTSDGHILSYLPALYSNLTGGKCLTYIGTEGIASVASFESEGTKPSMQFWKTLDLAQKDMPFKKKWDLIASIYNQCWDSSKEPYSSYDDIITIRNELVHFKGSFLENDEVLVRRLKSLTQRFKGESNWKLDALEASFWVHNLLTSKDMGPWIVRTLLEFDLRRDELLTGVPLTEEQIAMHKMKRMFN